MKGSITKTGENKWRLVFDMERGIDGKRRQKVIRFNGSKKDAEKKLRDTIGEYEQGKFVDPSNQRLADYLDYWLTMIKNSVQPKTFERYAQMVRVNINPALGQIKLQELKTRHLDEAYMEMLSNGRLDGEGGLAPKTIRNIHGVLSLALKKAMTWQLNWSNPAIDVTLPKVEHQEIMVLTKSQTGSLIQSLEGHWIYPIVLLALTSGMRRGEILALKWSNISLEGGWLRVIQSVEQTKAGKRLKDVKTKHGRRKISLPLMTVNMLRQHKARQAEELLRLGVRQSDDTLAFTSRDGQLRDPLYVSTSFREFMAQLDLPKVTFHGLRHTHISHLLEDGHPIKTVSSRAGHATVSITLDIYAHVLPDSQEKLAAAYGLDLEGMVELARNKN